MELGRLIICEMNNSSLNHSFSQMAGLRRKRINSIRVARTAGDNLGILIEQMNSLGNKAQRITFIMAEMLKWNSYCGHCRRRRRRECCTYVDIIVLYLLRGSTNMANEILL